MRHNQEKCQFNGVAFNMTQKYSQSFGMLCKKLNKKECDHLTIVSEIHSIDKSAKIIFSVFHFIHFCFACFVN